MRFPDFPTHLHATAIALARPQCIFCMGVGKAFYRLTPAYPFCSCVARKAFRLCLSRYHSVHYHQRHLRLAGSLSPFPRPGDNGGRVGGRCWWMRGEDYCADLWATARRYLTQADWELFRLHSILGMDWRECVVRMRPRFPLERGGFWHAYYRVTDLLGRVFISLEPYPLYPLEEYFHSFTPRHQPPPPPQLQLQPQPQKQVA